MAMFDFLDQFFDQRGKLAHQVRRGGFPLRGLGAGFRKFG